MRQPTDRKPSENPPAPQYKSRTVRPLPRSALRFNFTSVREARSFSFLRVVLIITNAKSKSQNWTALGYSPRQQLPLEIEASAPSFSHKPPVFWTIIRESRSGAVHSDNFLGAPLTAPRFGEPCGRDSEVSPRALIGPPKINFSPTN